MTGTWQSGWATGDVVTAAEFKKTAGAIFDSTLGASSATIDITGISATYAHLMVSIYARGDFAGAGVNVQMQFNGDAGANYDIQVLTAAAAAATAAEAFAGGSVQVGSCPANTAGANLFSSIEVFIPNYAGSTNNKQFVSIGSSKTGTTTGLLSVGIFGGGWRSTAAINRITFSQTGASNFVAGSRVTIHALGA